jgi:hypothetical protein
VYLVVGYVLYYILYNVSYHLALAESWKNGLECKRVEGERRGGKATIKQGQTNQPLDR